MVHRTTTTRPPALWIPAALALLIGSACNAPDKERSGESPPDVAAIRQQVEEELRAELAAEQEAARKPPPPVRRTLGPGERAAIARAKGQTGKPADDKPVITHVPEPGERPTAKLTEADRLAAADDPAASGTIRAPREEEPEPRKATPRPATPEKAEAPETKPEPKPEPKAEPDPEQEPARGEPGIEAATKPERAPSEAGSGSQVRAGSTTHEGRSGVKVVDLALARGVEKREPVGASDRFETLPDKLTCYCAIENRGEETTVTHVWRKGSRVVSRVELRVGRSPAWRTWSRQRIPDSWSGDVSCEVVDSEGARIGMARATLGR